MRRFIRGIALALTLSFIPACDTAKVDVAPRDAEQGHTFKNYEWSVFYGVKTFGAVDANSLCSNGPSLVMSRIDLVGLLVGGLTGGLVEPIAVKVTCLK